MKLEQAIVKHLGNLDQSIATNYDLGLLIANLLTHGEHKGVPVELQKKSFPDRAYFKKKIKQLSKMGIITPHKDFSPGRVFQIIGKKNFDAGGIACAVDPFAYVSHLSAMNYHGITDRPPIMLFVSSPQRGAWSLLAADKMKRDCGEFHSQYVKSGLPKLTRIKIRGINRSLVNVYSSPRMGAFETVRDRSKRVSTIGRTFLDMVREPKLCGGIRHVVEVFEKYGGQYANLIMDEVDRGGNKIEKVRIGYLLEEVCKMKHDRVEAWLKFVQRGGSRKLNPNAGYSPRYSERWC